LILIKLLCVQKLSQKRAESVVNYLIGKGIPASRLIAKGYGETQPIDTNDTEEGRQNNRRVEFKIISAEK
jgi:OOP family OmpA-OmpF porin